MKKIFKSREAKIGFLAIATIFLFIWGINYLKGQDIFNKQQFIYTKYSNVSGLLVANQVTINGLTVGQVGEMSFDKSNPDIIIVKLIINKKISIPSNSIARLYNKDLLGSKGIQIVLGNSNTFIANNDTLNSEIQSSLSDDVNSMIQPILCKAQSMMQAIDTTLGIIATILNENTQNNIQNSILSFKEILFSLEHILSDSENIVAEEKNKLKNIIQNVEYVSQNLKKNSDNINNIVLNFSKISDTIAKANIGSTLSQIDGSIKSLNQVLNKINNGDGNLSLLINNNQLYENLNSAVKNLDNLINDINSNPKKYLGFSLISF